jgi:CheY-like chemotaxis protein
MAMPNTPLVLLVEDDEQQSNLFAEILRLNGLEVDEAADGYAAIEAAQSKIPDIIVLDLMLPGMTGLQVAKILKRQPNTANIPIIAISGQAAAGAGNDAVTAGCVTYFKKPYSPMALVAEIKHWLLARERKQS